MDDVCTPEPLVVGPYRIVGDHASLDLAVAHRVRRSWMRRLVVFRPAPIARREYEVVLTSRR